MISIIIPAHNESGVLRRALEPFATEVAERRVRIIVVANGCTDTTAAIARSFPGVEVIETEVPSKSNALNLGDVAAGKLEGDFPRFFIDADVQISPHALMKVADALTSGQALAGAPAVRFDLSRSSRAVRAFYRVWSRLPYIKSGMIGTGVYAMSREGRARFDCFPSIIADDGYVRLQFKPSERIVVSGCDFAVTAPRNLWGLIKIKTRSRLGNVELHMKYPELFANEEARHGVGLAKLACDPRCWFELAVYGTVRIIARYRARQQVKAGRFTHWERDESSREASATA